MYTKRKIKELENGLQRDVMMFILHQSVLQNSHPESFPTVNEATHF